jgi:hypothetical protein
MRIWPKFIDQKNIAKGFGDNELDQIVKQRYGFWESFPKLSPIAFWEVETYSFGKIYRKWLGWPWFLPLPMIGDHGVELMRTFSNRESNSGARRYLTWSSWRLENKPPSLLEVHRIMHPWILYRRAKNILPRPDAKGTLVFISHTLPNTVRDQFNFDSYISSLSNLPSDFLPITLCVPMHDVRKGIHLQLKKYGLPIVTAGNSSSPMFVDRFYDLVTRFKFCTSNVAGSQLFYSEELGVPYFLLGEETTETQDGVSVSYYHGSDEDLVSKTVKLFTLENLKPSSEKKEFVSKTLGLDVDHASIRRELRRQLVPDTLHLAPLLLFSVIKTSTGAAFSLIRNLFFSSRSTN